MKNYGIPCWLCQSVFNGANQFLHNLENHKRLACRHEMTWSQVFRIVEAFIPDTGRSRVRTDSVVLMLWIRWVVTR